MHVINQSLAAFDERRRPTVAALQPAAPVIRMKIFTNVDASLIKSRKEEIETCTLM